MEAWDIIFSVIIVALLTFVFYSVYQNSYNTSTNQTFKIASIYYGSTGLPLGTSNYLMLEGAFKTGGLVIWHNYPVQGTIQLNETCTFNMIGGTLKSYICK